MEALQTFGQGFMGLFQNGANYFIQLYVLQLLPWVIIMITFMHILFKLIFSSLRQSLMLFCNLIGLSDQKCR